ncbi:MAG: GNAT family N-acetyltransferase [Immundisolibacter sp.]|uniref:GNAT family N-acetyltransferase n=1 Tax=Immundisolibacter sp. TaxID=1934948 RepID=UPI003EDE8FCA
MPSPQLIDLRDNPSPALLAAFEDLYTRTFTDPAERENPTQWPPRLYGNLPAPQPRMHLLVVVDGPPATTHLLGGIAFEHYRDSHCGLLTYLVIAPEFRRRGLGRQLIHGALARLHQETRAHGTELCGVFAETEDPDKVGANDNAMAPRERLTALARLGARRIDIPYVQPALEGGSGRCRHLLLLAFHPHTDAIPGAVVRDFLHEFYRALGIDAPQADVDFRAMERALEGVAILQAL